MTSRWDEPPSHQAGALDLIGTSTAETVWAPDARPEDVTLELIGDALRVVGKIEMRHVLRLSDHLNVLEGFFELRDVTLLERDGTPTRICLADLRVRLDDIVVIVQRGRKDPSPAPEHGYIAKKARRVVVMTRSHIIYGSVWLHEQAALANFVDSPDPRFMPMTDVRVRWLADRKPAGRFAFALVQRSHIIGMAESRGRGRREDSGVGAVAGGSPTTIGGFR